MKKEIGNDVTCNYTYDDLENRIKELEAKLGMCKNTLNKIYNSEVGCATDWNKREVLSWYLPYRDLAQETLKKLGDE